MSVSYRVKGSFGATALGLAFAILFPVTRLHAQGVALSGIAEAAQIVLPRSVEFTNLSVSAALTGVTGSPNVEFSLEWQGATLRRMTSGPPYTVSLTNLTAGKYFLGARLLSGPALATDVSFDIAATSLAPSNDRWSDAISIGLGETASATNTFASLDANEPAPMANAGGHSVWWKWQAVTNGTITATTVGSSFDTVLGVYAGTNLAGLAVVAANDDIGSNSFSQVSFSAKAGTNYYFVVDGTISSAGIGASGTARLKLASTAPPTIALSSPVNGAAVAVASIGSTTNVNLAAIVGSAVTSVDYQILGSTTNAANAGSLAAPYQRSLSGLRPGDFWLSVTATSADGLVATTSSAFSVIALSPQLLFADLPIFSTNSFQLAVSGFSGATVALEVSTNLVQWQSVATFTNFAGIAKIRETGLAPFNRRFYRARAQ